MSVNGFVSLGPCGFITRDKLSDHCPAMTYNKNVSAAGCNNTATEADLRRLISDAGFRPIKRDTLYRTYFLN